MNLNALRIFYEVGKYSSISIAAEHLFISQPAVSQQVKKLEKTYQKKLLKKSGRKIELTALGEKVYKQASILFMQELKIEELLNLEEQIPIVKIGGTQLIIEQLVKKNLIASFQKKLNIGLYSQNTEKIVELMKLNELDFAIIPRKVDVPNFSSKLLFEDRWVLVTNKNFKLNKIEYSNLEDLTFIIREIGSSTRKNLMNLFKNQKINYFIEVSNHEDAINLVLNNQGIYFCSYLSIREYIKNRKLKIIPIENETSLEREIYLYSSNKNSNFRIFENIKKRLSEFT